MLEIDCIYNGLRHDLEVGETDDQYIIYVKSNHLTLNEVISITECQFSNYGLSISVLKTKEDNGSNIAKLFIHH